MVVYLIFLSFEFIIQRSSHQSNENFPNHECSFIIISQSFIYELRHNEQGNLTYGVIHQ